MKSATVLESKNQGKEAAAPYEPGGEGSRKQPSKREVEEM